MSYLILIRHSAPDIQPGILASEWSGWQRCLLPSQSNLPYGLERILASTEKKAAQAVADQLGIAWQRADGLEEHHRQSIRMLPRAEFQALVARLLKHPQQAVLQDSASPNKNLIFANNQLI